MERIQLFVNHKHILGFCIQHHATNIYTDTYIEIKITILDWFSNSD